MSNVISLHETPEFQSALRAIREAAVPFKPFSVAAMLALCAERIARELATAGAMEAGVVPPSWEDLPESYQRRMRHLAELAIAGIDPDWRVNAAKQAGEHFAEWMNGPYAGTGTEPTHTEMAAKAISFYEQRLAVRS